MKKNMSFLFMMVFSICAMAQDKTVIERFDNGSIKSVRFSPTDKSIPANATEFFSKMLNKKATDDFVLNRSKKASNDMSFERYQQYFKGVKVEDGHYNFRLKNNKMKVVTGHYVDVSNIDPIPTITESEAIKMYALYLGVNRDELVNSISNLVIKETPEYIISAKRVALVYKVALDLTNNRKEDFGYVDAHTGEILYTDKRLRYNSATGQFYTYYNRNNNDTPKYGITEYGNNKYILLDNSRGNGIHTVNGSTSWSEFEDLDNIWTRSELGINNMALDVHWTMEQIYDWMESYFYHQSFDGNDASIISHIISEGGAYYDPAFDSFSFSRNIGSSIYGPVADVDVVGHEFGHGILERTTGWTSNSQQMNAMHEGFADIWGAIFENHITPNADIWKTGEEVMINGNSCKRNFETPGDPNAETQISSTYGDAYTYYSDSHIRGGIFPHWFYLLCQGGASTNAIGNQYSLLPLGFDDGEQLIAYTMLTTAYLEDCTTFNQVKDAFFDAALDLGGIVMAEQVANAWYAVGLESEPRHIYGNSNFCGSSTFNVIIPNEYTVSWSFTNLSPTTTTPTLSVNNSNNSCNVYTTSSFKGNLNATIKLNGTTKAVYSIPIIGDVSSLTAYYWENSTYMDVLWGDDNWVAPYSVISVESQDFVGKTFRISRSSSPTDYTDLNLNEITNRVEFVVPNLSSGENLTLWVTGPCGTRSFKFYTSTRSNNSNGFNVQALDDGNYLLSLSRTDDISQITKEEQNTSSDENWVFRVYNASDLQFVASYLVQTKEYILDTTSWKPGVYIIRAYIDGKPYTAKISVK